MPKDIIAEVAYDGGALIEGSMDVKDFAPALLALGEVIQEANRIFNGDRARIDVHVESRFEKGSFGLSLGLLMTAYQHVAGFFGPTLLVSAKEIAEYIGLITGEKPSLLALLKILRGEKPTGATTLDNGDIHIHIEVSGNHNDITVSPQVYQLANDQRVRKAVSEVVKPLRERGIDTFEVKDKGNVIERVDKSDLPAFDIPTISPVSDVDLTVSRPALLEVVKPSFSPELKWVFSDGTDKVNAYVIDAEFLSRVESGQRAFAKGDVLQVELRSTPHMTLDGLRTRHEVTKVVEEFNIARQMGLLPPPDEE